MIYEVSLSEPAINDLFDLYQWVAEQAGIEIADSYQARIDARLRSLVQYPDRGTQRSELGEGIRSIPFERRIIIFYRVEDKTVVILRVLSGARRFEGIVN